MPNQIKQQKPSQLNQSTKTSLKMNVTTTKENEISYKEIMSSRYLFHHSQLMRARQFF